MWLRVLFKTLKEWLRRNGIFNTEWIDFMETLESIEGKILLADKEKWLILSVEISIAFFPFILLNKHHYKKSPPERMPGNEREILDAAIYTRIESDHCFRKSIVVNLFLSPTRLRYNTKKARYRTFSPKMWLRGESDQLHKNGCASFAWTLINE